MKERERVPNNHRDALRFECYYERREGGDLITTAFLPYTLCSDYKIQLGPIPFLSLSSELIPLGWIAFSILLELVKD